MASLTSQAHCRTLGRTAVPSRHLARSPVQFKAIPQMVPSRRLSTVVRAQDGNRDSFLTGMVVGGAVFGVLGFLFAPQISRALLGDDARLRLPRFLDDEGKDPETTKQELLDKINQLNASIDEVAATLKLKEITRKPSEEEIQAN